MWWVCPQSLSATTGNPYRYVGQLGYYFHHQIPGIQNWLQLGVRFYDPEAGRFERRDPLRSPEECSYGYVTGRCFNRVDPTGEKGWDPRAPCRNINPGTIGLGTCPEDKCRECSFCAEAFFRAVGQLAELKDVLEKLKKGGVYFPSLRDAQCVGDGMDVCESQKSGALGLAKVIDCLTKGKVKPGSKAYDLMHDIFDARGQEWCTLNGI